jgi:hypothetical protein
MAEKYKKAAIFQGIFKLSFALNLSYVCSYISVVFDFFSFKMATKID